MRYFHGVATRRKRNNKIDRIKDDNGIWQDNTVEVEKVFLKYFTNIFCHAPTWRVDT